MMHDRIHMKKKQMKDTVRIQQYIQLNKWWKDNIFKDNSNKFSVFTMNGKYENTVIPISIPLLFFKNKMLIFF